MLGLYVICLWIVTGSVCTTQTEVALLDDAESWCVGRIPVVCKYELVDKTNKVPMIRGEIDSILNKIQKVY